MDEHRAVLIQHARSLGAADPEESADLAMLDGYRALGEQSTYDRGALRPYLLEAVDAQVGRERAMRWEEPVEEVPEDPGDPFEDIVIGALQLDAVLAELPPDQRDVLRLRFVEDLTSDEVGRRLHKTDGAVRQLQLRAIRRLRRAMFAAVVLAVAVVGSLVLILRNAPAAQVDEAPADRSSFPEPTTEPTIVERAPEIEEERSIGPGPSSANPDDPAIVDGLDTGRLVSSSTESSTTTDRVVDPPTTAPPSSTAPPPVTARPAVTARPPVTARPAVTAPPPPSPTTAPGPTFAGPDPGLAIAAAPPTDPSAVYDGFDTSTRDGWGDGGGGFVRRSTWSLESGLATVEFDSVGLGYTDRAGAVLATAPGEIRVSDPVDSTRLSRPDGASLWIDPNLEAPGPPAMELGEPPSPLDGMLRFKFNDIGDGAYTIDEVRLGDGFDQVAPAR